MLPPVTLTPTLFGTPARVNPFSLRQDLNGGRCKLLDTPSKSVISLTFALPALRDPCAPPNNLRGMSGTRALPRRCQSLPCTPELSRTTALSREMEGREEEKDGDVSVAAIAGGTGTEMVDDVRKETEKVDDRLQVEHMKVTVKTALLKEGVVGDDSALPIELEMVSLEQLEEEEEGEEEESVCITEPMDCTKSPEATEGVLDSTPTRPMLTSTSSSSLQTNGWRLPISSGPPSLPPLPRLDNNNSSALMTGQQWSGGGLGNGYNRGQVLSSDPSGPPEQDEVISCPGCCLVGLSFPSVCLRGSGAMPAQRRRTSLPRQRPYRNLNGPITAGSASSSTAAATATKALLCRSKNGLLGAGPSVPGEPGRSLPEAQT